MGSGARSPFSAKFAKVSIMHKKNRILVVCSNADCAEMLTTVLKGWAMEAMLVSNLEGARRVLKQNKPSLVVTEDKLSDGEFQTLLTLLAANKPPARVLVLLRDQSQYWNILRLGAFGVIPIPFCRSDVQWALIQALRSEAPARVVPFSRRDDVAGSPVPVDVRSAAKR
jgi:DNA-binding NtrC family response regulator